MTATVAFAAQAPFIGGAERALLRLVGALDDTRYRPFVIIDRRGEVTDALRSANIPHRQVALPPPERRWPWPFARSVMRIAAEMLRHRAVLLHTSDPPAHLAPSLAARLLRLPRICHVHFTYPADGLRWSLKWGFERALFASEYAKRDAQRQCPELFPEHRCAVIAYGFDPPPPPDAPRLAALRAECGLDADDVVIGFVGRVIESKGVADYLHMASALAAQHPRWRFLIVGDDQRPRPSYRVEMETLAAQLGIAPACRFIGFRNDVWDLLHLCDVVVMPSHVEPFGIVALEAGAAGRPVVAAHVGGIPEVVHDRATGVLVPPRDPRALANAVAQLIADPQRRAELGCRGRVHVAARFGLGAHARAVMDLYDDVRRSAEPQAGGMGSPKAKFFTSA